MTRDVFRGLPRARSGAVQLNADPAAEADPTAPGADDPFTRGLARDRDGRLLVELDVLLGGYPVVVTDLRDGQVLVFDEREGAWVNAALPSGDG